MNRHENIECKSCGKMDFTGRCYRCLSCQDFNMCAECYDKDFTTLQHPFDHPVKCIFTPADVEIFFGGEYLNDPPQSYRCPYCKRWGYNESTFLEHVSAEHAGASTLLVSTMVTLFEQQQAIRLFLEDEQLAVFSSAATSRNELISRNEGSLVLYLERLNPNGSYRRDHSETSLSLRAVKPDTAEVAPWIAESASFSNSNNSHNMENFLISNSVRRQTLLDRARHRLNYDRPSISLQPQPQLTTHPTLSDMTMFNEPMSTSRTNNLSSFRFVGSQPSNASINNRIELFGANADNIRRAFYPTDITRARAQRHRTPRVEGVSSSGIRQVHMQRLRSGPNSSHSSGPSSSQRPLEFNNSAHVTNQLLSHNATSNTVILGTSDQEQSPQLSTSEVDKMRMRFLCFPFISSFASPHCPEEEHISFLIQRAEFVAQLIASVLEEEELTGITPMQETATLPLGCRLSSESVGAGDSKLKLNQSEK